MSLSRREVLAGGMAMLPAVARAQNDSTALSVDISVPADYEQPSLGRIKIRCEWGAPPVASRPTVVLVADAQQFFLRPGGAARLQRELFGNDLNVLGIVGRSRSQELEPLIITPGGTDWDMAYRVLNWRQWAHDLDGVIRHFRLNDENLGLYGRSGGAHLIHQFLTLRPDLRGRVYVQAAANNELDRLWRLGGDSFWQEFSTQNSALARELLDWIVRNPQHRRDLVLILQRQHFFETLEGLPAARIAAVRAFIDGDQETVAAMRQRYQVDALASLNNTPEGIGSNVRLYEFIAGRPDPRGNPGAISLAEAAFYYAQPLTEEGYRPAVPATDWSALRDVSAEVLQIAGRHDRAADYRSQIGLNGMTRNSRLLILDDDHVFKRWVDSGTQPRFLQTFFLKGMESPEFRRELAAIEPFRWREDAGL